MFSLFVHAVLVLLLLKADPGNAQDVPGTTAAGKKHNVVFILTDDQDQRMDSLTHMPKVQKLLIDEGTWYQRHYAPTPLCCPARVSIWTGLHAHNHKVTGVDGKWGGWPKIVEQGLNSKYLPIWLRAAGYKTYYSGKLYNGMSVDNGIEKTTARGWTEAQFLCGESTYQYYNPPFQHVNTTNWKNPNKIKQPFEGQYSTTKVAEYAYEWLRDASKKEDPFFLTIAPVTPHVQVGKNPGLPIPEKKYQGSRPNAKVPPAGNFQSPKRSLVNKVWQLDPLTDQKIKTLDKHYQARTEALLTVDDVVEQVYNILKNNNKLEDTYIIYTSDNGFHLGHHRLAPGKKFAIEEDTNVPLIIRGPGVPKARKTSIVTAHVDLAPTILEMSGMEQRADFDGRKIPITAADINSRESNDNDEYANVEFWQTVSFNFNTIGGVKVNGTFPNTYKSLRLKGKNYDIAYTVHCVNDAHELYDLAKDRVQMNNLHPNASAEEGEQNAFNGGQTTLAGFPIRKLVKRLDAALLVLKSCKGTAIPCHKPWAQLHSNGNVNSLRDAMDASWDEKYDKLFKNYKVGFTTCYKNGRIDIGAEGPQWTANGPTTGNVVRVASNNGSDLDEWSMPSFGVGDEEDWAAGDDREDDGLWDDWE